MNVNECRKNGLSICLSRTAILRMKMAMNYQFATAHTGIRSWYAVKLNVEVGKCIC